MLRGLCLSCLQIEETKRAVKREEAKLGINLDHEIASAETEFTDEEGILLSELEGEFAELNGWDAETDAEKLQKNQGLNRKVQPFFSSHLLTFEARHYILL